MRRPGRSQAGSRPCLGENSATMPKEVFAEEIERFLGTLDGVAAARVFSYAGR